MPYRGCGRQRIIGGMDATSRMQQLVTGYRVSQAIHVAATLCLSDHLAGGPLSVAELATAADCDERTLLRLLRALASVEVYQQLPDGRFTNTDLGAQLRADNPLGLRPLAANIGLPDNWQPWSWLSHSVRTGDNAFFALNGRSLWEHRAANPSESASFDASMAAMSRRVAPAILDVYDFGRLTSLVDVAGGNGALLMAILAANPTLSGVLFDQPHVVAPVGEELARAGLAQRCAVVGGDMFDEVPTGGDAYLMKAIIHDWADPEALTILRNCRQAMGDSGVLLIVERILDPNNPVVTFGDLTMLVLPGGLERTVQEYGDLLASAGLTLTRVIPTGTEWAIVEAVPST